MENNFKYIVYVTINLVNYKYYIGVHQTKDPNIFDSYYGCGCYGNTPSTYQYAKTAFQFALKKYGPKNFRRFVIGIFNTAEEAYKIEELLVNSEMLKRKDLYNMCLGGTHSGGFTKEINQYDLCGNYIKTWDSFTSAASFYKITKSALYNAIQNHHACAQFYWSNEKLDKIDINYFKQASSHLQIHQYDGNGKYIKSYSNTMDIMLEYNVSRAVIDKAIQGGYKMLGKYYSTNIVDKFVPPKTTSIRGKKIYVYNLDGTYAMEFNSPLECAKYFGEKSSSSMSACLRLGRAYHKYQLSLDKVEHMKELKLKNQKKPIIVYDLNGNFIEELESITEATLKYGTSVKKVLRGQQNSTKGYVFAEKS